MAANPPAARRGSLIIAEGCASDCLSRGLVIRSGDAAPPPAGVVRTRLGQVFRSASQAAKTSRLLLSALVLLVSAVAGHPEAPARSRSEQPPAPAVAGADAPSWESLKAHYDYDHSAPLSVKLGAPTPGWGATEYTFTLAGASGETVHGLLLLPAGGASPYPCVLFLHGYGGAKEDARLALPLLIAGYAILALDARYGGGRAAQQPAPGREGSDPAQRGGVTPLSSTSLGLEETAQALEAVVVAYRRAVDYLETRADIDSGRLAVVGLSMGGIAGSLLAGVDVRIRATVLVSAGGGWGTLVGESRYPALAVLRSRRAPVEGAVERIMAHVEPLNFVSHISPRPLLMLNGRRDDVVPVACAEQLFARAGEPKQIEWYDSGHVLPALAAATRLSAWLRDTMKTVVSKKEPVQTSQNLLHRRSNRVVRDDRPSLARHLPVSTTSFSTASKTCSLETAFSHGPGCLTAQRPWSAVRYSRCGYGHQVPATGTYRGPRTAEYCARGDRWGNAAAASGEWRYHRA